MFSKIHLPDRPLDPPDNNDEEIRERAEDQLRDRLMNALTDMEFVEKLATAVTEEDYCSAENLLLKLRESELETLTELERSEPHSTISDDDGRGR